MLAGLIGYLIGIIPTAGLLAARSGIDLRRQGSGNPGANNAFQLGGASLGISVLAVEMAKGAAAALAGNVLGGELGMVVGGLTACAGNLYNVIYRFRGGKGLGITAGVLLVAWPLIVVPILLIIGLAVWATHSSDGATLITLSILIVMSLAWHFNLDLPDGWGLTDGRLNILLSVGLGILIAPKHQANVRFRRQPSPA